jgi:NADH dehydrogenase
MLAAGKRVRVLTLVDDADAAALRALGVDVRIGDISRPLSCVGLCDGVSTVFHLAAVIIAFDDELYRRVNIGGTQNIVQVAKAAQVGHFIHISSASVVYPQTTAYSRSKREAEDVVRHSGLSWTIVRPTLLYDSSGSLEYNLFLDYLRRFPIVPLIGQGEARKRPVFVEDVIEGLLRLIDNKKTLGKIYNFSGAQTVTMREFAQMSLELMGMGEKRILCMPVWLCRVLAVVMGWVMKRPPLRWPVIAGMIQDADLDPQSACEDLGYAPLAVGEQLRHCFPRVVQ